MSAHKSARFETGAIVVQVVEDVIAKLWKQCREVWHLDCKKTKVAMRVGKMCSRTESNRLGSPASNNKSSSLRIQTVVDRGI